MGCASTAAAAPADKALRIAQIGTNGGNVAVLFIRCRSRRCRCHSRSCWCFGFWEVIFARASKHWSFDMP
jgi:hypothetical protein